MKTTLQHSKHQEPTNADLLKVLGIITALFCATVLTFCGNALIDMFMSFIF